MNCRLTYYHAPTVPQGYASITTAMSVRQTASTKVINQLPVDKPRSKFFLDNWMTILVRLLIN
jgi:hypothetical protein